MKFCVMVKRTCEALAETPDKLDKQENINDNHVKEQPRRKQKHMTKESKLKTLKMSKMKATKITKSSSLRHHHHCHKIEKFRPLKTMMMMMTTKMKMKKMKENQKRPTLTWRLRQGRERRGLSWSRKPQQHQQRQQERKSEQS